MLIAGNWKMNTLAADAVSLATHVVQATPAGSVRVVICPPAVHLSSVAGALKDSHVALGAQNMHQEDSGAYTGEVSADMLNSVGCAYVILGHSERRQYFGETDGGVNAKVKKAMEKGLVPIVCVGETLDEREAGNQDAVVSAQVRTALAGVEIQSVDELVIAYEPVWAIGTGRTASPEQAQAMHAMIRSLLVEQFGATHAPGIHILYGGSMKPANADELLGQLDVDGGLIGGASLKADAFAAIIAAGEKHA